MEEVRFSFSMQDGQMQSNNYFNCQGERICLATGDLRCISVDKNHGNILLREEKLSDETCKYAYICIFKSNKNNTRCRC